MESLQAGLQRQIAEERAAARDLREFEARETDGRARLATLLDLLRKGDRSRERQPPIPITYRAMQDVQLSLSALLTLQLFTSTWLRYELEESPSLGFTEGPRASLLLFLFHSLDHSHSLDQELRQRWLQHQLNPQGSFTPLLQLSFAMWAAQQLHSTLGDDAISGFGYEGFDAPLHHYAQLFLSGSLMGLSEAQLLSLSTRPPPDIPLIYNSAKQALKELQHAMHQLDLQVQVALAVQHDRAAAYALHVQEVVQTQQKALAEQRETFDRGLHRQRKDFDSQLAKQQRAFDEQSHEKHQLLEKRHLKYIEEARDADQCTPAWCGTWSRWGIIGVVGSCVLAAPALVVAITALSRTS